MVPESPKEGEEAETDPGVAVMKFLPYCVGIPSRPWAGNGEHLLRAHLIS